MKILKFLPVLALFLLSSCDDKKETKDHDEMAQEVEVQDPAEVNKAWIDGWNKNNAASLDSLTARDAVLYMQGNFVEADSLRAWYKMAAPQMKNLRTSPKNSYTGKDLAYESGTYEHHMQNDSLQNTYNGAYTLIWKKKDNNWKLQVINITDSTPDTTAVNE
ncbi:YybH family protein [Christiangramia aquimixticola]|uniref:YybH family protein n=1 Tax=Christiangramia aquimixticola TaxID=1697558 RepID=UPI003AA870A5